MRVLFLGYQSIGHEALSFLIEKKENIVAVLTHRDDPGERIWWDGVADLAKRTGIPIDYDLRIDPYAPDIVLSAYYRHVVPMSMLRRVPGGGLNIHGSLLPAYRGRAPANWVLVNGESTTGVTLHEMISKPDAGPIVDQEPVPIHPRETIATLYPKLVRATRTLLERTWPHGLGRRRTQDESRATTFRGRRPEDGEIHWEWPVQRIDCLVRAVTHPYPGAFARFGGKKVYIWEGRPGCGTGFMMPCGDGSFEILRGQIEGESEMSGNELKERLE